VAEGTLLPSCTRSLDWSRESKYFYHLQRDVRFDHLRDRLIIDWGSAALSWVQQLRNKAVLEILPAGRTLPAFEDYLEFSLFFSQLKGLFEAEHSHRDWQASLSAVAGIYLERFNK